MIKLTSENITTRINSSFVEFEISGGKEVIRDIRNEMSCAEAIWIGDSKDKENQEEMSLGFDYMEDKDWDLLEKHMEAESLKKVKKVSEDYL